MPDAMVCRRFRNAKKICAAVGRRCRPRDFGIEPMSRLARKIRNLIVDKNPQQLKRCFALPTRRGSQDADQKAISN